MLATLLSLVCLHQLSTGSVEHACWTAYCLLATLIISPVWRANDVRSVIYTHVGEQAAMIADAADRSVITPTMNALQWAGAWTRYVLLCEWWPLFVGFLHRQWRRLAQSVRDNAIAPVRAKVNQAVDWVQSTIRAMVDAVCNFFLSIYNAIVAVLRGIRALFFSIINTIVRIYEGIVNAIVYVITTTRRVIVRVYTGIRYAIVGTYTAVTTTIVRVYTTIRDAIVTVCTAIATVCRRTYDIVTYVVFGHWVAPLKAAIRDRYARLCQFAREQYVLPIGAHIANFKSACVYVFYGHWIAPTLRWITVHWLKPIQLKAFDMHDHLLVHARRAKVVLDYFVYGQFAKDAFGYTMRQSLRLCAFVRREIVVPVWTETKVQAYNVAVWMRDALLIPFYQGVCTFAHELMVYIRGSVLEPFVDKCIEAANAAAKWVSHTEVCSTGESHEFRLYQQTQRGFAQ